MKRIGVLVGVATLLLMTSCDFFSKKTKEVVVAECYGKYLYASDLLDIVPDNTATLDSLMRVNAFIDSWIQRQVLLHQAETNLDKKELDLDKQLEEYRNSLVVYAYETKLIDQKLDTVVSEDEITEFYEQNKEDFQVRNTMVRAAYVILKDDCKQKPALDFNLDDVALEAAKDLFGQAYARRDENFGNARTVRKTLDRAIKNLSARTAFDDTLSDEDLMTITAEDIKKIRLEEIL